MDEEFEYFWEREKREALEKLAQEEKLNPNTLQILVNRYEMSEEMPLREDIADMLQAKTATTQTDCWPLS